MQAFSQPFPHSDLHCQLLQLKRAFWSYLELIGDTTQDTSLPGTAGPIGDSNLSHLDVSHTGPTMPEGTTSFMIHAAQNSDSMADDC